MMSRMKEIFTEAMDVAERNPRDLIALATFLVAGGRDGAAVPLLELLPTVCYHQCTEWKNQQTDQWEDCGDGTGLRSRPFARLTFSHACEAWDNYVEEWHARDAVTYRLATYIASDVDISLGILIDAFVIDPTEITR